MLFWDLMNYHARRNKYIWNSRRFFDVDVVILNFNSLTKKLFTCVFVRGAEKPHKKKNKFLGTEVPRNFSDQCSLDFAYFLCLFSGRRAKSSQELCSWELFFLTLGGFSPSDTNRICYKINSCEKTRGMYQIQNCNPIRQSQGC